MSPDVIAGNIGDAAPPRPARSTPANITVAGSPKQVRPASVLHRCVRIDIYNIYIYIYITNAFVLSRASRSWPVPSVCQGFAVCHKMRPYRRDAVAAILRKT